MLSKGGSLTNSDLATCLFTCLNIVEARTGKSMVTTGRLKDHLALLRALLADLIPEEELARNVLACTVECGAADALWNGRAHDALEQTRCVSLLVDKHGIVENLAKCAVATWAEALDQYRSVSTRGASVGTGGERNRRSGVTSEPTATEVPSARTLSIFAALAPRDALRALFARFPQIASDTAMFAKVSEKLFAKSAKRRSRFSAVQSSGVMARLLGHASVSQRDWDKIVGDLADACGFSQEVAAECAAEWAYALNVRCPSSQVLPASVTWWGSCIAHALGGRRLVPVAAIAATIAVALLVAVVWTVRGGEHGSLGFAPGPTDFRSAGNQVAALGPTDFRSAGNQVTALGPTDFRSAGNQVSASSPRDSSSAGNQVAALGPTVFRSEGNQVAASGPSNSHRASNQVKASGPSNSRSAGSPSSARGQRNSRRAGNQVTASGPRNSRSAGSPSSAPGPRNSSSAGSPSSARGPRDSCSSGNPFTAGGLMDFRSAGYSFTAPGQRGSRSAGTSLTLKLPGKVSMEFVWCPPGTFTMGSSAGFLWFTNGEPWRDDDEVQHRVTLSQGFWMARYPTTQLQYKALIHRNPSKFKGDARPVERVSWRDAVVFCEKLNKRLRPALPKGFHCTLPTEAQWEYACRAGTTSALNSGRELTSEQGRPNLNAVGWYGHNSGGATHAVGQKQANAWGLHDMHGNVCEWCRDWYEDYPTHRVTDPKGPEKGSRRVNRGGSWYNLSADCRSAERHCYTSSEDSGFLGFRLVLVR